MRKDWKTTFFCALRNLRLSCWGGNCLSNLLNLGSYFSLSIFNIGLYLYYVSMYFVPDVELFEGVRDVCPGFPVAALPDDEEAKLWWTAPALTRFHLARRFWNQILICTSVSWSAWAMWERSLKLKYFLVWNYSGVVTRWSGHFTGPIQFCWLFQYQQCHGVMGPSTRQPLTVSSMISGEWIDWRERSVTVEYHEFLWVVGSFYDKNVQVAARPGIPSQERATVHWRKLSVVAGVWRDRHHSQHRLRLFQT